MTETTDSRDRSVAEHVRRYLATDGRDGYMEGGMTNLILTTVGRKSGLRRRTGLFFGQDADTYVLVASGSAYGAPLPDWYLNTVANPEVDVQILADRFKAHARTTTGAERARLWTMMLTLAPAYRPYAATALQEIPIVTLNRIQ
ncbi:nitroreductase/quinone reductase family protein [Nonomuraea endophytica]|uniref:Deazaflavin-dependent oxidoreductase (Nitroreductase family) n=1 Tax=Nonomuraea endophytica TaxID=714136 RepID=A0A7W7ZVZ9_9ACTN|nr:nitroreductase/quinone reductase family protein [Nonomuraea endophytica]MBB5074805.1 deazaflavin-dependent oxidoreductase (nitroreductase family) [Nonomuraea endophytica]